MTTPIEIQFGQPKTIAPEVFIEFNNYYQDINTGGSYLGNLTTVNGEQLFTVSQTEDIYSDFIPSWSVNGVVQTNLANPKLIDLKGDYQGVMLIEVECKHLPTGLVFKRSKWGFLGYVDLPRVEENVYIPEGENLPANQWAVFTEWFPSSYLPYENARFDNDYDNNGTVTASDLTIYLSNAS